MSYYTGLSSDTNLSNAWTAIMKELRAKHEAMLQAEEITKTTKAEAWKEEAIAGTMKACENKCLNLKAEIRERLEYAFTTDKADRNRANEDYITIPLEYMKAAGKYTDLLTIREFTDNFRDNDRFMRIWYGVAMNNNCSEEIKSYFADVKTVTSAVTYLEEVMQDLEDGKKDPYEVIAKLKELYPMAPYSAPYDGYYRAVKELDEPVAVKPAA